MGRESVLRPAERCRCSRGLDRRKRVYSAAPGHQRGSPLAIKLVLQHPYSHGWLNATDTDGMVPLAYFFWVSPDSKYMYHYGMRGPYSGPKRKVSVLESAHAGERNQIYWFLYRL